MKRNMLLSLICTAGFACLQTTAFAQAPGGGSAGQSPNMPSTSPGANAPGQGPGSVPGQAGPESMPPKVDDKKFLKEAALGGMTEVELGKLAAQKATSDDVKQFGQKMVDDHTKGNTELKEVASKDNIQIPDALDSKHQSRIQNLSKLSGGEFDKAYIKDQLKDHQSDIKEFSAEAQNGTDPTVKAYASSMLPVLQEHLKKVKSLSKADNGGSNN